MSERFENVWDAIEGDPEKRALLKVACDLLIKVRRLESERIAAYQQALTMINRAKRANVDVHRLLNMLQCRDLMREHRRPLPTLEELLAQCEPNAPVSDEDREWARDAPVGKEII